MKLSDPRLKFWLLLAGLAAVSLLLRLVWKGHLLMYDEAMNLCSVRSFASGGHDFYSTWFWRYPPLFNLLLMTVRPLARGFAARAEWIPVALGLAQLVLLAVLNRRAFGAGVALWSAAALSLMPGSVFFGLWIKQDNLMTVMGLLSLLLCAQRKWVWCGLALGLAFLSKEMALFYAIALAIVLVRQREYRALAVVATLSAITAIWWYALFSVSVRQYFIFALKVPVETGTMWIRPWHHYFTLLFMDLGWLGLLLALCGGALLMRKRDTQLWPLALFLPAVIILTLAKGKTPWYVMTLLPALATMQGVAIVEAWRSIRLRFPGLPCGASIPVTAAGALLILLYLPNYGVSYEERMFEREPGMWDASQGSHQAALAMNERVQEGEKALVTPMYFYGDLLQQPCPIFVIYLKDMQVLVRSNNLSEAQFVDAVTNYGLDWAMVSPTPGRGEKELIEPLMRNHGLHPIALRHAVVFDTRSLKTARRPDNVETLP